MQGQMPRRQAVGAKAAATALAWCSLGTLLLGSAAAVAKAGDWPTYQHDIARSGITSEKLAMPLEPCWVFRPRKAPVPAWGDPKAGPVEGILELRRVHFDDCFQVAAAGGRVFFGSSAENKLVCLDGATGQPRWIRILGGPIRLAPTVFGDRVLVGCDDGYAYCFDAAEGAPVWQFHAAPEDRRVLGHGQLISLWPLRCGVLVDGGIAYLAAGIFPAEGVFLHALDARDGRPLWRNDTCGETPQSRISPQGYLLASKELLYVPMGRVSPVSFDRATGQIKNMTYFGKPIGGTYAVLDGDQVFTGTEELVGYVGDSRGRLGSLMGRKAVIAGGTIYVAGTEKLASVDRQKHPAATSKIQSIKTRQSQLGQVARTKALRSEQRQKQAAALAEELHKAQQQLAASVRWEVPCTCHEALILAGDMLVAGGAGEVRAVDAGSGKTLWSAQVDGIAKGLAVADGRLLVSTDQGLIYAFGPQGTKPLGAVAEPVVANPFAGSPHGSLFAQAAETILKETGIQRGYCLVLGLETGQLALELARRSQLTVHAVSPDAEKVAAARKALDAAGVYGSRVCVDQFPLEKVPYADYFANLIVSETAIVGGNLPEAAEVFRMLKPLGGTAMIGRPAAGAADQRAAKGDSPILAAQKSGPSPAAQQSGQSPEGSTNGGPLDAQLRRWLEQSKIEGQVLSSRGVWAKIVRGPLAGAGSWTHLYANAGNTGCSDDELLRCPLRVLWFGHPGPGQMVNRHARAAGPLAIDGRLFIQGENVVMAYDQYNSLKLWEREIPGAMRQNASHDTSNLAVTPDSLLVAVNDKCLRLDPATGRTLATFSLPQPQGKGRQWGYMASDGKLVFGSSKIAAMSSEAVFAVDPSSGKHTWVYRSTQIGHNAIAVGDGRVFLVDHQVTAAQRQQVLAQSPQAEAPAASSGSRPAWAQPAAERVDVRKLVALDARTGQVCWQTPLDLTHCGKTNVATIYHRGVLLLFGVYLDGHYWQQFFAGQFAQRRVIALSADDGKMLWSKAVGYRVRPIVIGDTLYAEPWAFDLRTGEQKSRIHPVSGEAGPWQFARPGHHCGCPIGSPHCLFFRSFCLGYYDLEGDYGTMHFGAQRPGCWVNFIPAGGLLLMPEASAGCMCPFPNMCSLALQPAAKNKAYGYYSASGPIKPVRRLGICFGAPGDRKDSAGNLWLGYPRPKGSLILQFGIGMNFFTKGSCQTGNSSYTAVAGADDAWRFASAAHGLRRCTIPLLSSFDGKAVYRVRLLMAEPEHREPGQRVFDIRLQGRTALAAFDPVKEAGGRDRAIVKEFEDVEVQDRLAIELVPRVKQPGPGQWPILQAIEILRQRVLEPGCQPPDFLVSSMEPKQTGELKLVNQTENAFEGVLQIDGPEGFDISPRQVPVRLAGGQQQAVPLQAAVTADKPAGIYDVSVKLLTKEGNVALQRRSHIEHLGRRGRLVIPASEDTYASQRYPTVNRGTATVLQVDGGDKVLGDRDHAMAYLKFRLKIPGRAVAARLRIQNAGNESGAGGRVCLVEGTWQEASLNYQARPETGKELAQLGPVFEDQILDCPLKVDLTGRTELSLVIDPVNCDGVDYLSRESGRPAELVIDYEPQ